MTGLVWLNGRVLPEETATISVRDRGFLLGDGAFETLRVREGRAHHVPRHVTRLEAALAVLRFQNVERLLDEVRSGIETLIEHDRLEDAVLRVTITRGSGLRGLQPPEPERPTVLISSAPPALPVAQPVLATGTGALRYGGLGARHKLIGYGEAVAQLIGAEIAIGMRPLDVVVTDRAGQVLCGTYHNLFVWRGNSLLTAPQAAPIRAGVMREVLIERALASGLRVEERPIPEDELWLADAILLTNAARGITRVWRLRSPTREKALPETGPYDLDSLIASMT